MLSTQYRLRLKGICETIARGEGVELEDMIWAQKLAKANTSAREMLNSARRAANNKNAPEEDRGLDNFLGAMGLGDPDPSNHVTRFDTADDIVEWFQGGRSDDWRQRD